MSKHADQLHEANFRKQMRGDFTTGHRAKHSWSELLSTEEQLVQLIMNSANLIAQVEAAVEAAGSRTPDYTALALGSMRDLNEYSANFRILRERRANRTHDVISSEEYTEYMALGLELSSLLESISVVVGTTMTTLIGFQEIAIRVLKDREASQKAKEAESAGSSSVIEPTVGDAQPTSNDTPVDTQSEIGDSSSTADAVADGI